MFEGVDTLRTAGCRLDPLPGADPAARYRLALDRVRKVLTEFVPGMRLDPVRLYDTLAHGDGDERRFALAFLHWLAGEWDQAEAALPGPVGDGELLARSGYWRARVRVLLEREDAVAEYEALLKRLGGSPQATAWYVDLLWRLGRIDRAESVWKAVRGNKRVLGCDEGTLMEARLALRKGEFGPAERLLREGHATSGVVHAERQLLAAWLYASQRKADEARAALGRAAEGYYPAAVRERWAQLVEARLRGEALPTAGGNRGFREYVLGQEARATGRPEALAHYGRAGVSLQPFVAHALDCLGQPAADVPPAGVFLAARHRLRHAVERFRAFEAAPGDLLEALDQAHRAGVDLAPYESYRQLAQLLYQRSPKIADLVAGADPVARRNALRIALKYTEHLPREWLALGDAPDLQPVLRQRFTRQACRQRDRSLLPPDADEGVARLLGDVQAAEELVLGGRHPGLLQSVRVVEAAQRGDVAAVIELLDAPTVWQSLRAVPPRFVLAALEALVVSKPTAAGLGKVLTAWLGQWPSASLGSLAGLTGQGDAPTPAGVEPTAWLLHQAARCLLRHDAAAAWTFVRRGHAEQEVPALETRALAHALAQRLGYEQPALLVDFVDLVRANPQAAPLLDAAARGEVSVLQQHLASLADQPDLPPRALHHLALIEAHLADRHAGGDPLLATLHARRAWNAWLSYLAGPEGPPPEARALLLDHLLDAHRRRANDHLSREEVGPARSHWQLVQQLPGVAQQRAPALAADLAARAAAFRDRLATDHLLTTREAMRFGDIPEGWRADYERGLRLLDRFLKLDPDNVRLLTAHVETCGEWFYDLYQLQDRRLFDEVERHAERADQLLGLVGHRDGEVAARSALSDYWKFKGFAADNRDDKLALYREALRLNPGNDNVRDLLAQMEGDDE